MKYDKPTVLISIVGGIAEVVACPKGVQIEIRDFDNNRELEEGDEDYALKFTQEEIDAALSSDIEEDSHRHYEVRVSGTDHYGDYVITTITVIAKNASEAIILAQSKKPGNWYKMNIESVNGV
jgi:hypothetical protein